MANRQFSIVAASGETLPLSTDLGGDFALMVGVWGIGVPPVQPRFVEGAADGGVYRGQRYGMRAMDLPIFVRGIDRTDIELKARLLARLMDVSNGLPKLVVTYDTGEKYELPFAYVSGLEGDGSVARNNYVQYTISVLCPNPFWEAQEAVQFSTALIGSTVGLLPDLAALQLMASDSFGSLALNNPGDVPVPINWIVTGPGSNASAVLNGRGWSYAASIASGTTINVVRSATDVLVRDGLGLNRYGNLAPAPKFFDLPAGPSTLSLGFTGADTTSRIAGYFKPRRKVVY